MGSVRQQRKNINGEDYTMRKNISLEELTLYFNISRRTMSNYMKDNNVDFVMMYNKLERRKTIRDKKTYLYSLKNKYDEDILDFIWESLVERLWYEYEIERFKTNKKVNQEISWGGQL